jgi:aspartate 1-decarboxylase
VRIYPQRRDGGVLAFAAAEIDAQNVEEAALLQNLLSVRETSRVVNIVGEAHGIRETARREVFDFQGTGPILDTFKTNAWTGSFRPGLRWMMRRSLFKSKIHRATVTDADLDYEGSVTIDEQLMHAANILQYERVEIWNVTNGSRLTTYALAGEPGSGVVCVNGAAARHAQRGDKVIIATFADLDETEARGWKPVVVRVDERNRIIAGSPEEIPGPQRAAHLKTV